MFREGDDMIHIRSLVAVLAAAAIPAAGLAAPTAAGATCDTRWGSLPEASTRTTTAQLTGIRAGQHACFDRLVLDLNGRAAGYRVSYVPQVYADGSGALVPLRGGARLSIVVLAPAYDASGRATYRPANRRELVNVTGYRTFRQVAWAGSFEGQTTIGLGVRARLPFRVFVLAGPGTGSRVVIDVAHTW
jgi:hypothetical protein